MAVNTSLFELIKSLDSGELRYLRLYSVKYHRKGKSNAQKLFDAVLQQEEYDEKALKEKFKGEKWVKHFASEKKHLFDTIVRGLADYEQVNAKKDDILTLLVRVEVLYKKRLYPACAKLIKKGKKLALDYEYFEYVFHLNHLQSRISLYLPDSSSRVDTLKEHRRLIKVLDNLNEYQILYEMAYDLHLEQESLDRVRVGLKAVMSHPLMQGVEQGLSYSAKKLYYSIAMINYWTLNQREQSYEFVIASIELTEAHEMMLRSRIYNYVSSLTNLAYLQADLYKIDDCEQTLEKYRALPTKYESEFKDSQSLIMHKLRGFTVEANLCKRTADIDKILALIPAVRAEVLDKESNFITVEVMQLYCDLSYNCLVAERQSIAIDWYNQINKIMDEDVLPGLNAQSQLVNLLAHYDLGNHDHVLYLIHALRRYMSRCGMITEQWQPVFRYLVELNQAKVHNHPKANSDSLLRQFLDYLEANDWDNEIIDEHSVNLAVWLRSKVQGEKMADILHRNLEQELQIREPKVSSSAS